MSWPWGHTEKALAQTETHKGHTEAEHDCGSRRREVPVGATKGIQAFRYKKMRGPDGYAWYLLTAPGGKFLPHAYSHQ